jgi:hypothetical protein
MAFELKELTLPAPRETLLVMPQRAYPGADRDPTTRLFDAAKKVVPERHWTDLEQALSGPNSDNVCTAVSVYISACLDRALAVKALYDYKVSIGDTGAVWCHETQSVLRKERTPEQTESNRRLCDEAVLASSNEFKAYRALLVEIHGERAVEFAEYLDRRRDRYGWNDYGAPLTLRDWDEDDGYYEDGDGEDEGDNGEDDDKGDA